MSNSMHGLEVLTLFSKEWHLKIITGLYIQYFLFTQERLLHDKPRKKKNNNNNNNNNNSDGDNDQAE